MPTYAVEIHVDTAAIEPPGNQKQLIGHSQALVIASQKEREEAGEILSALKNREKEIIEHFKPMKHAVDASKKLILEQEKSYLLPVSDCINEIKKKALAWDLEQQRIAREAEAKAKRETEEAVIKVAETLQSEGKHEAAEKMLSSKVAVRKEEFKPQKVSGQSVVTRWNAEVTDITLLIKYCHEHPEWAGLLTPSQSALDAIARAQKETMSIPGVKAVKNEHLSVR